MHGNKNFAYTAHEVDTKCLCASLDAAQRRLGLGYSDGRVRIVSAISGSELCEIDRQYLEGGCVYLVFALIYAQKRILACTGAKSIVLFEDLVGNRTRFVRSFVGHTELLSSAIIVKGNMVLSIGMGSEIFLWSLGLQNPLVRFKVPNDPTVAMDIPGDPDKFLVGDMAGFIHWMSKGQRTPFRTVDAFKMSLKSPLSSLQLLEGMLITSNMHGYVKLYNFFGMTEIRKWRAHSDAVMTLSVSAAHRLIVTSGDEHIRVWSLDPPGWIGSFGVGRLWQLDDAQTWQSPVGVEEDPVHFAPVQPVQESAIGSPRADKEEEDVAEEETTEEMIHRMDESNLRSVSEMMQLLEAGDELVMSGRKVIFQSKDQVEAPMYPLTSGPPPAPRPAVANGYATLINGRFSEKSLRLFESQMGKPRIIRPTGSPSESSRRRNQD
jgi:hypothetical protein